jgi:hypothetical protein
VTTPRLVLTGDLDFEVDGTSGTVHATDRQVRVDLVDPVAALRAVAGTYGGRPGMAQLAAAVTANGVTVRVHGPRGLLASIGSGIDSRLGGALTGSRQVSPGRAILTSAPAALGRRTAVAVVLLAVTAEILRRRG